MNSKIKLAFAGALLILLAACTKSEHMQQSSDEGARMIKFQDFGGTIGTNFTANSNLEFDFGSTEKKIEVTLRYSGPQVLGNDISATISVDTNALRKYNQSVLAPLERYQLIPEAAYQLPSFPIVIKAGQIISEPFFITFYAGQLNRSINYMLPITITGIFGAPGDVSIAEGNGTAYFHFIGNSLAGIYNMTGMRYNYFSTVSWPGPPATIPNTYNQTYILDNIITATALNSQTVYIPFGNVPDPAYGQAYYFVSTESNFAGISYDFSSTFNSGYSNIQKYIVSYTPPGSGQPISFHLVTHYTNTAGNDRIIDQTFTHQ